jgi:hypothetical protein
MLSAKMEPKSAVNKSINNHHSVLPVLQQLTVPVQKIKIHSAQLSLQLFYFARPFHVDWNGAENT